MKKGITAYQYGENEDMEIFESALDRWPYIDRDDAYSDDEERM